MGHGRTVKQTVRLDHIDNAAVRESRDAHPHNVRKRCLVVQRAAEDGAGLAEKMMIGAEFQLGFTTSQSGFGSLALGHVDNRTTALDGSPFHLPSRDRI